MQAVRTICCKLDPTPEQAVVIEATLAAFANACNFAADAARRICSMNRAVVHHEAYFAIRATFKLSANLTVRAIARVCIALKTLGQAASAFTPTSIDYDERIFCLHEADWTFGLTLLPGRLRFATILGDFQRDALRGKKPTSATLVKRSDGAYFLHIQIKETAPDPVIAMAFLGVDLGITNIATDSTGETFSGEKIERHRKRRMTARKQYQRAGTRSAKRRLKKMAGRQGRFQRAENHRISKHIVAKAKALGIGIAMEDLSGLRIRCEQTAGKRFRRRLGNWGFFQFRQFVEYKAVAAGVPVVMVDPRNTSRTCSACGHCEKANRPDQATFRCKQCGHSMNADVNAALNISAIGASVNCPQKPRANAQGQSLRL